MIDRGEEGDAAAAEVSIRWLVEQKHTLGLLNEADTLHVLDRISDLHEQAYGWQRPEGRFYVPAMSAAERMRTKVRYCVEALDLAYVYMEAPVVQTHKLEPSAPGGRPGTLRQHTFGRRWGRGCGGGGQPLEAVRTNTVQIAGRSAPG